MSAELAYPYPPQFRFNNSPNPSLGENQNPFSPSHPAVYDSFDNKTPVTPLRNLKKSPFNSEIQNKDAFTIDLRRIAELQTIFNRELGITKQDKLNYNPVLARWKFESLSSPADIEQFKKYELWQIQTALYERNQIEKNSINYTIGEDGEIYNELFPDEPFRNVLLRGIEYQKRNGTVDPEREQAEFDGWEQICELLKDPDTQEHTTAMVISGPSSAKDSPYQHNFIDAYKLHKDPITKKRFIKMTRTNSNLTYEQYKQIVEHFEPDYFHGMGGPIDAWHLGKPLYRNPAVDSRTIEEIMEQNFGITEDSENAKMKLELSKRVDALTKHFIGEGICNEYFDPRKIAKIWNALLNMNDIVWDQIINKKSKSEVDEIIPKSINNMNEAITWLNTKEVQAIAAACGSSAGFNLNESNAMMGTESAFNSVMKNVKNSVAQFGFDKDKHGSLEFDCPKCSKTNKRPYGKLIEKCQHCGSSEVACKDEGNEQSEQSKKPAVKGNEPDSRIFIFPRKQETKKQKA